MLNETNGSSLPVFALSMLASLLTSVQLVPPTIRRARYSIIVALSAGSQNRPIGKDIGTELK